MKVRLKNTSKLIKIYTIYINKFISIQLPDNHLFFIFLSKFDEKVLISSKFFLI